VTSFAGFRHPNHTQVPNDLFEMLPEMDKAELKVVLAVVRATLGFHRDRVALSLTKLQELTGLTRSSVGSGARAAEQRGVLSRRRDGRLTVWEMRWLPGPIGEPNIQAAFPVSPIAEPSMVRSSHRSGLIDEPPSMKETVKQTSGKKTPPAPAQPLSVRHLSRLYPKQVELMLHYTDRGRRRRKPLDPFVVEAICDVVGSDFSSLLRWGRLVRTWMLRSYKPTNIEGMLRAYREGGLQSRGNGRGKPNALETLRSWAAEEVHE